MPSERELTLPLIIECRTLPSWQTEERDDTWWIVHGVHKILMMKVQVVQVRVLTARDHARVFSRSTRCLAVSLLHYMTPIQESPILNLFHHLRLGDTSRDSFPKNI
jgi:hypothetical protein